MYHYTASYIIRVITKPFNFSLVTVLSMKQLIPHAAYYHVLQSNACTRTFYVVGLIIFYILFDYHYPFAYLYQLYLIIMCVEHGTYFVRLQVLTAMTMKIITVIWNPTFCSSLERYCHFGGMCCLYLQGTFMP
jgi:hypothetical protein